MEYDRSLLENILAESAVAVGLRDTVPINRCVCFSDNKIFTKNYDLYYSSYLQSELTDVSVPLHTLRNRLSVMSDDTVSLFKRGNNLVLDGSSRHSIRIFKEEFTFPNITGNVYSEFSDLIRPMQIAKPLFSRLDLQNPSAQELCFIDGNLVVSVGGIFYLLLEVSGLDTVVFPLHRSAASALIKLGQPDDIVVDESLLSFVWRRDGDIHKTLSVRRHGENTSRAVLDMVSRWSSYDGVTLQLTDEFRSRFHEVATSTIPENHFSVTIESDGNDRISLQSSGDQLGNSEAVCSIGSERFCISVDASTFGPLLEFASSALIREEGVLLTGEGMKAVVPTLTR